MPKKTTVKAKRPAISEDVDKRRMRSLAYDNLMTRLEDGTATSQMIALAVSISSEKEQLELEKLKKENALLEAKVDAIETQKRTADLVDKAIEAFKTYSGNGDSHEKKL